jgi:hypothetical protein
MFFHLEQKYIKKKLKNKKKIKNGKCDKNIDRTLRSMNLKHFYPYIFEKIFKIYNMS